MRTRLLTSIALALVPLVVSAAPLGTPVNVTADPPAAVQQLPFLSLTSNSAFLVFNDDTTRAGRMMNGQPLAHPVTLDTTILRDGGAASIGDQSFGVWLHDDWMYGQRFDAAGNTVGSPAYLAMVDSRHTMRLGVGASTDHYLVAWAVLSRVVGSIVDTNGNILEGNNAELVAGTFGRNVEAVKVASIGDEFLLVWESTGDEPWSTPCTLACPSDDREVHAIIVDNTGAPVKNTEKLLAHAAGEPDVVSNGVNDYFVVWTNVAGTISGVHIAKGATAVGPVKQLVASQGYGPRVAWDGAAYDLAYVDASDSQALRAVRLDAGDQVADVIGTPVLHQGVWPRQFAIAGRDGTIAVTYVDGKRLVLASGKATIPVTRIRAVRHH
ncbi:MAG TPA: hypothetical protein VH087_00225 [Thermoanaerobaculia bacterium]|nr:hypothetical protein [Thermoanaerobaculia bacterium]